MIQTVTFTGPRPKKLFGYNDKESYQKIVDVLKIQVKDAYDNGARRFISGGAQGLDQMAFWAVYSVKKEHPDIQNILYIPHKKQADAWSETGLFSKKQHELMLSLADEVKYIDNDYNVDTSDKKGVVTALMLRNQVMVDDSDLLIALYPHNKDYYSEKGGTEECIKYAIKQPHISIKRLDPVKLTTVNLKTGLPREDWKDTAKLFDLDFD